MSAPWTAEHDRLLEEVQDQLSEAVHCLMVARANFREVPEEPDLLLVRELVTEAAWRIASAMETLKPYLPSTDLPPPVEPF